VPLTSLILVASRGDLISASETVWMKPSNTSKNERLWGAGQAIIAATALSEPVS
jgi:hypothetical protein